MATHRIFPHGLPSALTDNVWQVKGSSPTPLPRYMTIVRLGDGRLFLYSVVAMDDAGMRALEALGALGAMLIPHTNHVMDAAFYAQRYPGITVIAPAELRARLDPKIHVTGDPETELPKLGLKSHRVEGFTSTEIVLEVATPEGTALVFSDAIMAVAPGAGFVFRLLGPPGGCGVPRIVKFRQAGDKPALRSFLLRMANTPNLSMIVCSHGAPIRENPADALRMAAKGV